MVNLPPALVEALHHARTIPRGQTADKRDKIARKGLKAKLDRLVYCYGKERLYLVQPSDTFVGSTIDDSHHGNKIHSSFVIRLILMIFC